MLLKSTNNHVFIGLLLAVASVGCRQGMTINGQSVAANKKLLSEGAPQSATAPLPQEAEPLPASQAAPVDLPGALSAPRQYTQTRGSFTLTVAAEALADGDTYSVIDETNTQTLIDHQSAPTSGGLLLSVYPLDPAYLGKLRYGGNQISLVVDGLAPKTSEAMLRLHDFSVFVVATTAFPAGSQRRGGLQGGFSTWRQDIVAGNGTSTLSTGLVPVTNQ